MRTRVVLEVICSVDDGNAVVVLAAAVHAFKGLLVLQADQTILGCDLAHHFHGQQVVVDGYVGSVIKSLVLMVFSMPTKKDLKARVLKFI